MQGAIGVKPYCVQYSTSKRGVECACIVIARRWKARSEWAQVYRARPASCIMAVKCKDFNTQGHSEWSHLHHSTLKSTIRQS